MSAIKEVTFRVEGYDNKADSSRAEDDMDVFGRRERSGASCNCNLAAGCNGRLKNDMKEKKRKKKNNSPITSEGVEMVSLCLFTPHFLTLLI